MTKSLVRLSLLGVLLVAIATPALAHRANPAQASNATLKMVAGAAAPTLVADESPIPWPCGQFAPPSPPDTKSWIAPTLTADSSPIPWPKPTTTTEPPANTVSPLVADGPLPIPWPKPTTTTEPPANAGLA